MKKFNFLIIIAVFVTVLMIIYGSYSFNNITPEQKEEIESQNEEIRLQKLENEKKRKEIESEKYPLLVLSFDDGAESDYNIVYPMLSQKGIEGTSFIVGNWLNTDGYMTVEQVRELDRNNWDIQDHTYDHLRLKEESTESIEQQVLENEEVFKQIGIDPPDHLALPYGQINDDGREVIAKHKKTIRNVGATSSGLLNDWENIELTSLNAVSIDTTDIDRIKKDIDHAMDTNSIIILFGHKIGNDEYQTPLNTLEEITDYIVEIGIETVTISEMFDRVTEFHKLIR